MSVLLPRLDRELTALQLAMARELTIEEIAGRMPTLDVKTTSSALGGVELTNDDLGRLREAVLTLAREYGYPEPGSRLPHFDALCARVVHEHLRLSPHEAAEDDGWSHLTCCWLLDIAAWRWGGIGESDRRFRGDVNRNTFRRLWWRAEVLGADVDLTRMGEDPLVNIMERPTISSNVRLARSLATQFLARTDSDDERGRMVVMREAGKRLIRLTPIVDFYSLDDEDLNTLVGDLLDAAATGDPLRAAPQTTPAPPPASEGVEEIARVVVVELHGDEDETTDDGGRESTSTISRQDFDELLEVALGIARRTGRVTNGAFREVVPMEPGDARRVLQTLVERGDLARRGKAKGTYYVLPSEPDTQSPPLPPSSPSTPPPSGPRPPAPSLPAQVPAESTLRRFLRRARGDS